MAEIIIVRHGDTLWNRSERFRGMIDIELDETGRQQAALTAKRIAKLPVSKIYSSPVSRAMQTAEIIAKPLDMEVCELSDIRDISFGRLEGLSMEEAGEKFSDVVHRWLVAPDEVTFPGGESLGQVKERASKAVERLLEPLADETVLFVSHKVVIIELIIHFLGMKDSQFRQIGQDTCAVNVFQKKNDRIYAILLNDTCHLQGLQPGDTVQR
jgi:phosphoserine phosphatase